MPRMSPPKPFGIGEDARQEQVSDTQLFFELVDLHGCKGLGAINVPPPIWRRKRVWHAIPQP